MTMQRIPKSRTYPIVNITVASKTMEHVMRDSSDVLGRNFGNIAIPPIIAPVPKEPNRSPKPVESSLSTCLAKSGKRDNSALLHNVNKPARTINTCAA
jgi:hypothetical protein